jgi:hypothetical protein
LVSKLPSNGERVPTINCISLKKFWFTSGLM